MSEPADGPGESPYDFAPIPPDVARLNYSEAFRLDKSFMGLDQATANRELKWVAEAFLAQLDSVNALLAFPVRMMLAADAWRIAQDIAARKVLGTTKPAPAEFQLKADEIRAEAEVQLRHVTTAQSNPKVWESVWEAQKSQLEYCSVFFYPNGLRGGRAILSSAILTFWTAYESLATDLWVQAVDLRPTRLAASVLAAGGGNGQADANLGKSFPSAVLQKHKFDLRGVMGRVLRETKKVNLDSLKGLDEAYRAAFGNEISSALKGASRDQLGWLEAVRNVLAHRGGRADDRFLERVKRHPVYKDLKDGDEVPIDGRTVSEFGTAVVRSATSLHRYVDKWLTDNPE
jgi:hypothetical protein